MRVSLILMMVAMTLSLAAPQAVAEIKPENKGSAFKRATVETSISPDATDSNETATLTDAHGSVFKRGYTDNLKRAFAQPVPAKVNDKLEEGMQMGTGNQSWAEITWPEVVTRQWSNTVIQLMPNKRIVYLADGEMLFRLRKEGTSSDYTLWTKVLQARVRGTSVLLQRTPDVTRLTVLEGMVDIKNFVDQSEVRLGSGAVYEVLTPGGGDSPTPSTPTDPNTKSEADGLPFNDVYQENMKQPVAFNNAPGWDPDRSKVRLPIDVSQKEIEPIHLFRTPKSSSSVWVANADAMVTHPLVNGFESEIDSIDKIKSTISTLPAISYPDKVKTSKNVLADRNRLLSRIVEVLNGPPTDRHIEIGRDLGFKFALPSPVAEGASNELKPPVILKDGGKKLPTIISGSNVQRTNGSSAPGGNEQRYQELCRKAEEFKTAAFREKNERTERLKRECAGLAPDECMRRKQQLESWEREQMQKHQAMVDEANRARWSR